MIIKLSPIASSYTTTVSLSELILTIDGIDHDLSVIPIGGEAEGDIPFIGKVTRDACTIQYHYESALAMPNQSTNQADYVIDASIPFIDPIRWRA
jgi:hypothetical protein